MKKIIMVVGLLLGLTVPGGGVARAQTPEDIRIVALGGLRQVEVLPHGSTAWVLTQTNQTLNPFDRLRVGPDSSAAVLFAGKTTVRFAALTEIEIRPRESAADEHSLNLLRGILSFFHRDQPGRIRVISRGGTAGIKGTEFVMSVLPVNGVEQTTVSVVDGDVQLTNTAGALELTDGQQAVAAPGVAPARTSGFIANNVLQWCFYYPGVLDLNDLAPAEKNFSGESAAAYRAGNLPAALATFPENTSVVSDEQRLYRAALLLNNAQIAGAEKELAQLGSPSEKNQRLADALRMLIAAVRHETISSTTKPQLTTEFLAASYYAQSQPGPKSLDTALAHARQAVAVSPQFGFGWERVAELEFSFGRTDRAQAALDRALKFSPHNAQALALKGFLLAAKNKTRDAIGQFDRALAQDSALGNAWLGRGLCRIRSGDLTGGREDLLIAAAMEPDRAALRSYLGKSFGDAGGKTNTALARHELALAKNLDPHDPTAWLYSALLNEQNNRVNEAVRDLEKSQELNNNRAVYRAPVLLDQDRAVRSANLARAYAEAGLEDYALRIAGESVAQNYGSFGSHLFLANAYAANVPAGPFGRRYETPAFSENLITILLGPVDSRIISQGISQQEYARSFERDGAHFSSDTEYSTLGAWSQYGVHYGTFGGTSYAIEGDYSNDPGQAKNADLEFHTFSAKIKQQLTPEDSIYLQVYESSWQGGDTSQHYNPTNTIQKYRFKEEQVPNIVLGYHHEWSADSHTLFIASRFDDHANFMVPSGTAVLLLANPNNPPVQAAITGVSRRFDREYIANTFEVQQVQKIQSHTLVAGARIQFNEERVSNQDAVPYSFDNLNFFPTLPYTYPKQNVSVENNRASLYLLDFWRLNDQWLLFGGVDADYLRLARNTIAPPLSTSHDLSHPVTPKAGLMWQPSRRFDFTLAYAESVTGQDLDQSVRLNPTDFAGLPLNFRTAIPDSLTGGTSGERDKVWHANSRFQLGQDNYGLLGFQHLQSAANREVGSYTGLPISSLPPAPSVSRERLDYQEDSVQFSLRHLFGNRFSTGLRYEAARAQLKDNYAIDPGVFISNNNGHSFYTGVLHTLTLDALMNLPNGIFAGASSTWRRQAGLTDTTIQNKPIAGDNFWQVDMFAGYRSPLRHFELRVALLNLTGQDYRLDPVNGYPNLPRKQTLALSVRFNF